MEISDDIQCVFSAKLDESEDSYIIEVPERELSIGDLEEGEVYRVAVFESRSNTTPVIQPQERSAVPEPPVDVGEQRTVEIEDLGEQGDGIARVERGYVIIVPDTDVGERVIIEITDISETVGFAEVVERKDYYE